MADPTVSPMEDGDDEKMSCATEQPLRLPSTVMPRSIPELLWQREVAGTRSQYHHHERVARHRKQFFGDLAPSAEQLSSTIAWNASRMQNMILTVGPGTPASLLMTDHHVRDSSSSTQSESDDDDDDEDDDVDEEEDGDEDDDDDQLVEAEDDHDGGVDVVADEEKEDGGEVPRRAEQETAANETDHGTTEHVQSSQPLPWIASRNERYAPVPSMRHGGCINTATWLTSPWRLSTVSHSGPHGILSSSYSSNPESAMSATTSSIQTVTSNECPTQLLTSGDDRVVKIWDVSMAMGTANPLYGGTATVCPFSAPTPRWSSDVARKRWKNYYLKRMTTSTTTRTTALSSPAAASSMQIAGSVIPLLTLSTGHRANIFHVTPLDWQIGKVATCGADGFLRLSDIVSETNSVVVSPEYDESPGGAAAALMGFFNLHTNMCFSHVFLNANTGLLCSERGLKRFDIRLSPREQPTQNLLGNTASSGSGSYHRSMSSSCCKACAVYSYSSLDGGSDDESAYVFAGGSSATVSLYDLRMTGGNDSSSRVIERYRPKSLNRDTLVSVSGLDISKDRRELLVSYENDQIYTFPIFPKAKSAAGPSLDEILEQTESVIDGLDTVVPELCSYGAHLNRFTFLKNAKYAGPKDDYICTGSDSGRAWIYERSSGAVVSLLNADRSTCNGVVPHPSLPFFITYGIDSTAKLWRATLPVDSNVDDSAVGRAKCFHQRPYEMSPLVRNWEAVQGFLDSAEGMTGGEPTSIFPDQVPHSKEMVHRGRMGRAFLLSPDPGNTQIGNDLHNLPQLLRQNAFACLRALRDDDDEPVRSGFGPLKRRLSAIRLRHQADETGLLWNRSIPWLFEPKRNICTSKAAASSPSSSHMDTSSSTSSSTSSTLAPYGDLVDLVPDNPSDWIPFDPHMSKQPLPCGTPFNVDDYEDVLERYRNPRGRVDRNSAQPPTTSWKRDPPLDTLQIPRAKDDEIELVNVSSDGTQPKSDENNNQDTESSARGKEALRILCETATLLKEGGNVALQAGNAHLAATRYDKALQYCAVAFMDFPSCNLSFRDDPVRQSWSPLLKVLISTRLNLSMCLLRPEIAQPQRAIDQAQLALAELKRFGTRKVAAANGEVEGFSAEEPNATYLEAKELQAKAYFRLGSAQYDLGDYAASCKSFEQSAKITKATSKTAQPDKVIMRRLAEAKRENARQSKRQKKMFKFMFSGHDPDEATPNNTTNDKKTSGVAAAAAEAATITTTTEADQNATPSGEESKEVPCTSADEEMESSNEVATSSEVASSNDVAHSNV